MIGSSSMTRSWRALPSVGVLCALGCACLHGCSWLFVTPAPKPRPALQEPVCTQSIASPVVDTVFAAAFATLTVSSLVGLAEQNADDCDSSSDEFCIEFDFTEMFVTVAVLAGAGAGVHTASAVYGYGKTDECREANDDWYREQFEAQSRERVSK